MDFDPYKIDLGETWFSVEDHIDVSTKYDREAKRIRVKYQSPDGTDDMILEGYIPMY
jgi:hypothetical protein